jgi:hypothetical protein
MMRRLIAWWKRLRCKHVWRPALSTPRSNCGYALDPVPAKHCNFCDTTVPMTVPEFYALFGNMPAKYFTPWGTRK